MTDFDPKRLRALRLARGLTADQTATAANRSTATYDGYESGAIRPTMESLDRLAHVLQCSIDAFFDPDAPATYDWPTPQQREDIRREVRKMAAFTDDEVDSMSAIIAEVRRASVRQAIR
jgi:transcriptional regulator with XRE-family HTH domain